MMMTIFAFVGIGLCSGCGSVPAQTQALTAVNVIAAAGDSTTAALLTINLQ
jgi:hypothetical protein